MKKIMSFLLAVVLVLSLAPSIYAAYTPTSYREVSRKTSNIAPGVTQDIVYTKLSNNEQMVYYLATVDVAQPDVNISAGYKDQDGSKWGLSKTSDQVAAAMKVHTDKSSDKYIEYYNVVAAINADFYNMVTGQPEGAFAIEGKIIQSANGRSFFAMRKDGSAVIGFNNADWTKYNTEDNPIVDAVGGSTILVQNGVVKPTSTADLNARTAIGVTEDGKVVMLVTDGKQSPYSAGADMKHIAEILLEAGCVTAINLDGGGSTTYLAKQEGEDKISLVSRPCDGSERSTSTGLLVYTTIVPDGTFDHAALSTENDYVTPGATVAVEAIGVSATGASADLPEDAVLQVEDSTLGGIKNGAFVSSGKAGDAVIQMVSGGKVVGSATIHVVVPDALSFPQDTISVPYGKSSPITVNAMYGLNQVTCHDGDITLTLSDENMGTLDGFTFTACESSANAPTSGTLTAAYLGREPSVTANVNLGRGSEIVIDFDDPSVIDNLNWACENGHEYNNRMTANWVDASTGKVHDGKGAVAFTTDLTQTTDFGGWQGVYLGYNGKVPLTDAIGVGFWLWVPDEVDLTRAFIAARKEDESGNNPTVNGTDSFTIDSGPLYDEGGWHYIYVALDKNIPCNIKDGFLYIELRSAEIANRLNKGIGKSEQNRLVWYVDSVTVDYSTVRNDREAPIFDTVYLRPNVNDNIAMTRGAVTDSSGGTVSFSAAVAEDTSEPNYTGLNMESAEAFIDGVPVDVSYKNGALTTEEVTLAAGTHTLKMGISDNARNYSSVIRQFRVSENANEPTIKLVPHDTTADRIPIGSVYYVDVVATDVAAIDRVELDMDLNNISVWELANADVDYYFDYKYSVEPTENIGTVTLTRKKTLTDDCTGEAAKNVVLASLPIRTWELDELIYWGGVTDKANDEAKGQPLSSNGTKTYTPADMWSSSQIWPTDISIEVDRGEITYADSCTTEVMPSFSGDHIQVDTELFSVSANVKAAYPEKTRHHAHTLGAAEDKDPDCLHAGYTGRVFCTVCKSPVTWGTTVPATGHNWAVNTDGKLACTGCDKLYTGEYEGKNYKDGVMLDGWVDDSYYKNGAKLTGIQELPKPDAEEETETLWYLFDDDGVCEGKKPYTGEYEEKGYQDGVLHTGWLSNDSYYINGVKQTEEFYEIDGKLYRFEDGVCDGQKPYTGFRTVGENRYYYEFGVLVTGDENGWFQVGDETCHACEDRGGALGTVTITDSRNCVDDGFIFYLCSCGKTFMSEALWAGGHKWKSDTERVCTVCGHEALDISNVRVEFAGSPYHVYTGSAIRAAHTVYDGDRQLIIESDRRGSDGLATYENNVNVGKATLKIEGRGNYDEKTFVTANFYIIPANVPALRAQTGGADSVLLDWDAAPGATYYAVYQRLEGDEDWTQIGAPRTTSFTATGLEQGSTYEFRVGSRAEVAGEKDPYVCANWTETAITLEHEWGEPFDVVEGSCTTDGSYKHTCTVCDKTEEVLVPAPGHDVEEWETTAEPTIREPGIKTGVCTVCEESVTQEIEKLPSYAINIKQAANGSVSAEPDDIAGIGDSVTVAATPNSGYKLDKLSVTYTDEDGTHELEVTEGVFLMPSADVTVTASFTRVSTGGGSTGGGGGSSSGSTPSNTTTNDDGSTTRTETKTDGTTVETTTKTDGSKIETETKPDGSKTVEVKQADGTTASATVSSDGKTEAEVKLSDTAVQQAAGSSIVLPIPEVKVDRTGSESAPTVKVSIPQTTQSDKPVRVTVPVAEIKSGDVAVIVNPDGSETVVKKSVVTEDGLSVPLEGGATIKIVDNSKEFEDATSHWSHDAVRFVTSRELFNGVSEDSFAPDAAMDRAMLVTVLHRLEDLPAGGQVRFPDVKGDTWYSEAVAWASEKNIVNGYQNGSFGPGDRVTREQIAAILYRYAATQNVDTGKMGSLAAFADGASTASWAQESMSWAVGAGLFQGSNGRLEPQKSATRAEVAVILQRFVEYMAG